MGEAPLPSAGARIEGNFQEEFGVIYGRNEWSPGKQGETMPKRKYFYTHASLIVGGLFFPLLATAQHSTGSAAMSMHMVAPSHPMMAVAPTGAMHAPIHPGSPQVYHPARPASYGAHPVYARSSGHPISTKAPIYNHPGRTNGSVGNRPMAPRSAFADDGYATPGLGFDYAHYAAVHPRSRYHHSFGGGVYPFVGGGIYLPSAGYFDAGGPQESVDESPQGEGNEQTPDYPEAAPFEQPAVSTPVRARSSPAPAPTPEYVFVRRDGTVFFAVAFSWLNGNLQYVTQDGMRKLVSQSALDLDATAQFNEQRGVAFHSPA